MKKQMFILEINDTQDHSWQGQLKWIQGDNKQSFRSVVELLRLIDSAINEEETVFAEGGSGGPGDSADPWEGASPGDPDGLDAPDSGVPDD